MKSLLIAACILGVAVCAPARKKKHQAYMEFDIIHTPSEALEYIPAGAPVGSLDVLLPVDAKGRPIAGSVRGFIKQEIPRPNGQGSKDLVSDC
ncbi:secretory calcium-binding phosphoprotein 7 [Tautogolabrus adspersus]